MLAAVLAEEAPLGGLLVGGVELADLPDPALAEAALAAAGFVVSLEIRASSVTRHADVVFPVAPVAEKAGMFVDWEGRVRPFAKVLRDSNALPDLRVLAGVADEMGVDLGFKTVEQARTEMSELGAWDGDRLEMEPTHPATAVPTSPTGEVRVATWKMLIDDGRMLDGEDALKATGRTPVALVSPTTLAAFGLSPGQQVTLTGDTGSAGFPVGLADLPDGVVWVPTVTTTGWAAAAGSLVRLSATDGGRS
jgi:NADH-quinone oxidoreductase subunit G